ncbi:hypothetical protein GQ53DRAFT_336458 [Thozetella sp. PMI_491]|nr:hypothetical protein GQ53DRAFT_336458 [Thozetella sp. PMI_491]
MGLKSRIAMADQANLVLALHLSVARLQRRKRSCCTSNFSPAPRILRLPANEPALLHPCYAPLPERTSVRDSEFLGTRPPSHTRFSTDKGLPHPRSACTVLSGMWAAPVGFGSRAPLPAACLVQSTHAPEPRPPARLSGATSRPSSEAATASYICPERGETGDGAISHIGMSDLARRWMQCRHGE